MHSHHHNQTDRRGRGRTRPVFPDRGEAYDRIAGATRGRGSGRGRGRGRAEDFGPDFEAGFGRHGGFGPSMFGRGPKRGRGDVRAAIIALLAEEPMHGYQIITELTERSGGIWRPSPGSVYPTLQALEDQGLVTADRSAGRRVFSLTEEGRAEAEAAGDGPAPWERAARGANRSLVDLRGLMVEVAKATMQVGRAGSELQVRSAAEILNDTRRRLYLVLADGVPSTGTTSTGTPAAGTPAAGATEAVPGG